MPSAEVLSGRAAPAGRIDGRRVIRTRVPVHIYIIRVVCTYMFCTHVGAHQRLFAARTGKLFLIEFASADALVCIQSVHVPADATRRNRVRKRTRRQKGLETAGVSKSGLSADASPAAAAAALSLS